MISGLSGVSHQIIPAQGFAIVGLASQTRPSHRQVGQQGDVLVVLELQGQAISLNARRVEQIER
jgi:hypothetical protein